MTVAEAWCAAVFVVKVEIEESRFALAAVTTFDILLASTESIFRVARWRVVVGSVDVALARLTTVISEIEVVRLATVALVATNALLTLTLSFRITLQRS